MGLTQQPLPWMALDMETLERHADGGPPILDGLTPRRVMTRQDQNLWQAVMAKGFVRMTNEAWAFLERTAEASGYGDDASWWRFIGELDGEVVGSSGIVWTGGVAGIYNVATPPEHRRRGIATTMSLHALRTARSNGYRVAVLGSSDLGRGVYERLGFREVCVVHEFEIPLQP
jgi:ribosomal protein S18 acetylase RimI-like enzyme